MNNQVKHVEQELGVTLPPDYSVFISSTGIYVGDGIEVYGHSERLRNEDGPPSVIGATRLLRKTGQINESEIVISHTGFEDYVVALDTRSGVVYEINHQRHKHKIFPSFREWLQSNIGAEISEVLPAQS